MADRTVRIRLEAAVDGYRASLRQSAADTRQTAGQIQGHIRDNRQAYTDLGVAAGAAGVAAAAGIKTVLSAGVDFSMAMNQVKAVSGATGQEFAALSSQARELGASTRYSASEAAEGMGFLAMAGFDATQTMQAMPGVLQLAAAGAMDLGTAADIASNVLTGFGLAASEVGRVNDAMAATFTTTNTDLRQLGEAMKYVAPVAAAAGVSLEEVAAAIGLMGNAGIQGSMAGTSLRGAITRLLNPSAEAARILARLGIEAENADGSLVSLDTIVQQLERSGATTGEMMSIFGQRAGPAMAALVSQGADALRDQTTVALESAGTAAQIAETQMEGLGGSLIELKSAAEGAKIALFEAGSGRFAEGVVDSVTEVLRGIEGLPPAAQNAVMGVGGVTAVVGTLSGAALLAAPRIVATGDAIRAMGGISRVATAPLRGLLALINPYTIAIGLAAVAVGLWAREKAEARRRTDELIESLKTMSGALRDNLRELAALELMKFDGLQSSTRTLGLSMTDLVEASVGVPGAIERVNAALDAARQSNAGFVSAEQLSATGDAIDVVQRAIGDVAPEMARVEEGFLAQSRAAAIAEGKFLDVQHALDHGLDPSMLAAADRQGMFVSGTNDVAAAAATAGSDIDGLGEDFGSLGDEIATTVERMEEYNDAVKALFDPVFAVTRATQKLKDAQADVKSVMEESKSTQEDRHAALLAEVEAALELDGSLRILWGAMQDGAVSSGSLEEKLSYLMTEFGLSRDAAELLLDQLDDYAVRAESLPDIEIDMFVNDMASGPVQRLLESFDKIPRHIVTTLQAERAGTSYIPGSGGQRVQSGSWQHDGGWAGSGPTVYGPAGPDEVDARLQLGEFVLSRQMVARPDVQAVLPRLHAGGPVGSVATTGGRQGAGAGVSVTVPLVLDGRELARSEFFIDALSGQVASRGRQTAGAGL